MKNTHIWAIGVIIITVGAICIMCQPDSPKTKLMTGREYDIILPEFYQSPLLRVQNNFSNISPSIHGIEMRNIGVSQIELA